MELVASVWVYSLRARARHFFSEPLPWGDRVTFSRASEKVKTLIYEYRIQEKGFEKSPPHQTMIVNKVSEKVFIRL